MKVAVAVAAFLATLALASAQTNKFYGYYGSWAIYGQGDANFQIYEIDAVKFSHITYAFIGLNEDGTINILDSWADIDLGGFSNFVGLRNVNPNLKVLISMGGWGEGSERYSRVINDYVRRQRLVNAVYDFLVQWGFDGFDFDWEYPAQRGGAASDYYAYIDFLRELRDRVGNRFLITAAVGAAPYLIGSSYNVPEMNRYLDYINLMTYDFHGSWDGFTGHNSPLYSAGNDNHAFSISAATNNWIANGASAQKLLAGVAFYGQSFNLQNAGQNWLGAPTNGPGPHGGFVTYLQMCTLINQGGWNVNYDWDRHAVYAHNGNSWISYDNAQSVRAKAEWARNNNLAGIMVWAIDYEDNNNVCGTGWNILLNTIADVIRV